ncbi:MAG TPA: SRPBCC domain-containing protein [Saprospiraceae bacterium]|nr:SRPBCC domain-containing protein [Saprospiraceae bacterium]HPN68218.1 SRPBCC domain-containing protein [Saprospiraceae bacterium]
MSKEIKTSIVIKANPASVWEVLSNFERYEDWNPFIKSIKGDVVVGKTITVSFGKMTFKPLVLAYDKNQKFEWIGHLFFKGIFDGKHTFELVDNGDGTTTFLQSEFFKGIIVPFLGKMLREEVPANFKLMNEALKKRVEEQSEV